MPRKARISSNTSFYHIMVQGINREYIFQKDVYKEEYIKLLKMGEQFDTKVIAYCIMDNHSHMLIHTNEIKNMSNFMSKVNLIFAIYYNKREERVGTVFRDRFKSEPIYTKNSLFRCMAYIHNNPVKANMVRNPEEYKYSTYRSYIRNIYNNKFVNLKLEEDREMFFLFHFNNFKDSKFLECQGEKEDVQKIIYEFINRYNLKLEEIKENKNILKKLVKEIKYSCNVTNIIIANELGITKSTIGNYLKSK